jgi:uncharacterized protein (DUF2236 family)
MTATSMSRPAEADRRREPELFGPGDLLWELNGHWLFAASTGSAFLLQVMHPAIGTVVDRRSTYRTDPWGRAERSFASVQTWVYGGPTAVEEGHRLRHMHRDLAATDERGRHHHALSAEPWAWVPLTSYHAVLAYARYFLPRPLTPAERDRLYGEVLRLCRILQVPERMLPADPDAYRAYLDHMIENVLENHPTAHTVLATAADSPPLPGLPRALHRLWPPVGTVGARVNRLISVGTLPPAARDKLGLTWTDADERALRAFGRVAGEINTRLPERVRYMPIAYRAREAARARQRLVDALEERPR